MKINNTNEIAASETTVEEPKKKMKKRVALISGGIVLFFVIVFGLLLAFGYAVTNSNEIYPNVGINGVDVGGLTVEKATSDLEDSAFEENLSEKSVLVTFPGSSTLEITAQEAGFSVSGAEAAQIAYEYGRSDGILSGAVTYLKCKFKAVDLDPITMLSIDETQVRGIIDEAVEIINSEIESGAYELTDDTLTINKGRMGIVIDEDELFDMVENAFKEGNFGVLEYDTDTSEPEPVDLQSIYDEIYTEPENAVYDKENGGVTEHVTGISFDIEAAESLMERAESGADVEIPLILTQPEITSEYLESVLFADRLSSKTTSLTSSSNRNTNVELAANAISGTVLNPGEEFSFNDIVGQRTAAKGYKSAGAYLNGELVNEIGGGICQVSSTIYYTALVADLEIVNRSNHRYVVSYLPMGMDATVSWGGPEFVFKNNTDYPIKIVAYRSGLNLSVELYGTKTNSNTIDLEYVLLGTLSYSTTYEDDSSMLQGETSVKTAGKQGYVVETYKNIRDASGNLLERQYVNKSTYSAKNQVILQGTKASTPPPATSAPPVEATPTVDPALPAAGGTG